MTFAMTKKKNMVNIIRTNSKHGMVWRAASPATHCHGNYMRELTNMPCGCLNTYLRNLKSDYNYLEL